MNRIAILGRQYDGSARRCDYLRRTPLCYGATENRTDDNRQQGIEADRYPKIRRP
jgi:hypothetical protein